MNNKFYDLKTKTFHASAIKITVLNELLNCSAKDSDDLMSEMINTVLEGVETDIVQELLDIFHPVERDKDGFFINYPDYMDGNGFGVIEEAMHSEVELKAAVMGLDIYSSEASFKKVLLEVMSDQCDNIKILNYTLMPCQEKGARNEYQMDVKIVFAGDEWVIPTLQCRTITNMPVLQNGETPETDNQNHVDKVIDALSAIACYKVKQTYYRESVDTAAMVSNTPNTIDGVGEATTNKDMHPSFGSGDLEADALDMAELDLNGNMKNAAVIIDGKMMTAVMIGEDVLITTDGDFKEDFREDFLALFKKHAA